MTMTKRIILCADDYGMSPEVSEGILQLVKLKRLSAVSCMSNYDNWQASAQYLKPFYGQVNIGLHFNLSGALSKTIALSYLRLLSPQKIKKTLQEQYDLFVDQMGFMPDYLDGHQHIHALPIIRDVVVAFWREKCPGKPIRCTRTPQRFFKARVINCLGAKALARLLKRHNIPHNGRLLGIYNFKNSQDYAQYFKAFLVQANDGDMIMCHPGGETKTNVSCYNELCFFLSCEAGVYSHNYQLIFGLIKFDKTVQ